MSELYKRIEALCKEQGITITEMCRRTGVPRANLTELKMGRQQKIGEVPLGDALNYEALSEFRQRDVLDFTACASIWRCYDVYGEKSVGRNAGTEDWILQIWTIETIERSEIEYLFNRWTNPA